MCHRSLAQKERWAEADPVQEFLKGFLFFKKELYTERQLAKIVFYFT